MSHDEARMAATVSRDDAAGWDDDEQDGAVATRAVGGVEWWLGEWW